MNNYYGNNRTSIINYRVCPKLKKDFKKMCENKHTTMAAQIETLMIEWMKGKQKDLFK